MIFVEGHLKELEKLEFLQVLRKQLETFLEE